MSDIPKTDAEVLELIQADCESDADRLDGQPFTGRTVAEQFGKTLAMVSALAQIVERQDAKIRQLDDFVKKFATGVNEVEERQNETLKTLLEATKVALGMKGT